MILLRSGALFVQNVLCILQIRAGYFAGRSAWWQYGAYSVPSAPARISLPCSSCCRSKQALLRLRMISPKYGWTPKAPCHILCMLPPRILSCLRPKRSASPPPWGSNASGRGSIKRLPSASAGVSPAQRGGVSDHRSGYRAVWRMPSVRIGPPGSKGNKTDQRPQERCSRGR